jgi:hypothetical protein
MTIESESPQTPERPQQPGTPPPPPPPAGPPAVPPAGPGTQYPVSFDVEYPEQSSRATTFFRGILLYPQNIIVGYGVATVAGFLALYSVFTLLFAKRHPREGFTTQVWCQRWLANFAAYSLLLRDRHPPFTGATGKYPVTYDVAEPPELSRGLPLIKWLLAIPHYIVLFILYFAVLFCVFIAWFAILFTGRYPRGFFNFVVGVHRWQVRVSAYAFFMLTDRYPPFSFE